MNLALSVSDPVFFSGNPGTLTFKGGPGGVSVHASTQRLHAADGQQNLICPPFRFSLSAATWEIFLVQDKTAGLGQELERS